MATRRAGASRDGRSGSRSPESRSAATAAGSGENGPPVRSELSEELRRFIGEHAQGWGHDDWLQLLEHLRGRGHDIHDPDAVGALLERQRLTARLETLEGIGPRRIRALSDRYGSIWNLGQADTEELARSARIPRALAERIRSKF
jgi:excinuclease ABC subunit C